MQNIKKYTTLALSTNTKTMSLIFSSAKGALVRLVPLVLNIRINSSQRAKSNCGSSGSLRVSLLMRDSEPWEIQRIHTRIYNAFVTLMQAIINHLTLYIDIKLFFFRNTESILMKFSKILDNSHRNNQIRNLWTKKNSH